MARHHSNPSPLPRRVWREAVWLVRGWRDREPPDRWNPVFVRELRRGSWRDGLAPRVVILQVSCLFAWFMTEATGHPGPWALLPAVSSLATLLLEARAAAADQRGGSWELFQATGSSHRLWWRGWKRLHFVNLLAALSTLLPWAIVVNLTRTSQFELFCVSAALCLPASCLTMRRWTAFGLATTPWKRWTMMALALLWIEPMLAGGWFGLAFILGHQEFEALLFAAAVLAAPVLFSLYCAFWVQARVRGDKGNDYPAGREGLVLFSGCVISLLSIVNTPTLLFFIVMAVNLSNRKLSRHSSLPFDETDKVPSSVVEETIRTFRI